MSFTPRLQALLDERVESAAAIGNEFVEAERGECCGVAGKRDQVVGTGPT